MDGELSEEWKVSSNLPSKIINWKVLWWRLNDVSIISIYACIFC